MKKTEFVFKTVPYGEATVEVAANVWHAKEDSRSSHPVAIYFHGGGYIVGSKDDIPDIHIDMLLQHGFVVVSPNYRLCPTINAVDGPIQDCRDCYAWVQDKLSELLKKQADVQIDPERVVTFGGSCGGSLAHLMSQMPKPPKAILDFAGMKHFDDPSWHTPIREGLENMSKIEQAFVDTIWEEVPPPVSTRWLFGSDWPNFKEVRVCWMINAGIQGTSWKSIVPDVDTSLIDPVPGFSRPGYPPKCFVNGTRDGLVDVIFARRAYEELKGRGVDCELLLAEGLDHAFEGRGFEKGGAAYDVVEKAFAFLAKHVYIG